MIYSHRSTYLHMWRAFSDFFQIINKHIKYHKNSLLSQWIGLWVNSHADTKQKVCIGAVFWCGHTIFHRRNRGFPNIIYIKTVIKHRHIAQDCSAHKQLRVLPPPGRTRKAFEGMGNSHPLMENWKTQKTEIHENKMKQKQNKKKNIYDI